MSRCIFVNTVIKCIKRHRQDGNSIHIKSDCSSYQPRACCIHHSAHGNKRLLLRAHHKPPFCMPLHDAGSEKNNRMQLLCKNTCSRPGYTFRNMLFFNNSCIYNTPPRGKSLGNSVSPDWRGFIYTCLYCILYIHSRYGIMHSARHHSTPCTAMLFYGVYKRSDSLNDAFHRITRLQKARWLKAHSHSCRRSH